VNIRLITTCLLAFAIGSTAGAKIIGIAVKRGQQSVDPQILPLACITITMDNMALPLDVMVLSNLDTHETIKAILSKTFDTNHPDLLTAISHHTRSLSMPILHLKPGHYLMNSLEFVGPAIRFGITSLTFDLDRRNRFVFEVKPGCVNYVGSLVISADWSRVHTPHVGENAYNPSPQSAGFNCSFSIEETTGRDAKWAADVVPGMGTCPRSRR
jgi:hypothetical protein